jgi:hypothetical protein
MLQVYFFYQAIEKATSKPIAFIALFPSRASPGQGLPLPWWGLPGSG